MHTRRRPLGACFADRRRCAALRAERHAQHRGRHRHLHHRNTDVDEKFAVGVDAADRFPFLVRKLSPYYDRW